jgi:hypothetical protein
MLLSAWAWLRSWCSVSIIRGRSEWKRKRVPLAVWPGPTRFTCSSKGGVLLVLPSNCISPFCSLSPSSQVSESTSENPERRISRKTAVNCPERVGGKANARVAEYLKQRVTSFNEATALNTVSWTTHPLALTGHPRRGRALRRKKNAKM